MYPHVHLPSCRPPEISPIQPPIALSLPKIVYYFKRTHFHPQTVPRYLSPDTGAQRHCTSTCPLYPDAETPQPNYLTDNTLNAGTVFPLSLSGIGIVNSLRRHSCTHAPGIPLILVSHATSVLVVYLAAIPEKCNQNQAMQAPALGPNPDTRAETTNYD